MNETNNAGTRLLAKKRFTKHVIGRFIFESLNERHGLEVGILSAECLTVGWADEKYGNGSFKVWRAQVADRGSVSTVFVTISRDFAGNPCRVEVS